jgi:hypothetical protein
MAMKLVPLAMLVEDLDIYPRHAVDSSHVNKLNEALAAGVTLPPILVDAKTHRIVDGVHRSRAYRKNLGVDASIEVETRSYRNELALLKDAVRLNVSHGRSLESQDLTRATLLLQQLGATTADIAYTLNVTEGRLVKIAGNIVNVGKEKEARPAKPSLWPSKNGEPRNISNAQYAVHQSSNGWRHRQTIKQLTKEIQANLVALDDETVDALRRLRDAIDTLIRDQ